MLQEACILMIVTMRLIFGVPHAWLKGACVYNLNPEAQAWSHRKRDPQCLPWCPEGAWARAWACPRGPAWVQHLFFPGTR